MLELNKTKSQSPSQICSVIKGPDCVDLQKLLEKLKLVFLMLLVCFFFTNKFMKYFKKQKSIFQDKSWKYNYIFFTFVLTKERFIPKKTILFFFVIAWRQTSIIQINLQVFSKRGCSNPLNLHLVTPIVDRQCWEHCNKSAVYEC